MAYEKTVWQSGDLITAERMNKIEQRLEEKINGRMQVLEVHEIDVIPPVHINGGSEVKLDKTWQQIYDAFLEGKIIKLKQANDFAFFNFVDYLGYYFVYVEDQLLYTINNYYICVSPNDYPYHTSGGAN